MAFVPPPPPSPCPSQDPYSRFRLSLSVPASLNAHLSPPLLPPRPSTSGFHRDLPPPFFDSRNMPPPPVPLHARKRKHHHQGRSPSPVRESSASPTSEPDSEYDPRGRSKAGAAGVGGSSGGRPKAAAGAAKGANSKVGPNGRPMSREQLRKANHSLIERRRREKINAALADLRSMVPGLGEENGGKGGEFKLEVLERTVEHMRELKRLVADLESQLDRRGSATGGSSAQSMSPAKRRRHESTSDESMDVDEREDVKPHVRTRPSPPKYFTSHRGLSHHHHHGSNTSPTPPSPSVTPPSRNTTLATPDPNETEDETNLPPPLTLAHRERERASDEGSSSHNSSHTTASPHPPSISSLLSSATQPSRTLPHPSSSTTRPSPSPNLYLPFPTPSPTSPFLTYHASSASTASSATGPPEPSPFLAPLQNISLFGGALETSPLTGPQKHSPPEQRRALDKDGVKDKERDMGAEEAASLLLAISSPDTMRPMGSTGSTPLMSAVAQRGLERRLTLDAEDFTLDGGVRSADGNGNGGHNGHGHAHKSRPHQPVGGGRPPAQGKTARDILRM